MYLFSSNFHWQISFCFQWFTQNQLMIHRSFRREKNKIFWSHKPFGTDWSHKPFGTEKELQYNYFSYSTYLTIFLGLNRRYWFLPISSGTGELLRERRRILSIHEQRHTRIPHARIHKFPRSASICVNAPQIANNIVGHKEQKYQFTECANKSCVTNYRNELAVKWNNALDTGNLANRQNKNWWTASFGIGLAHFKAALIFFLIMKLVSTGSLFLNLGEFKAEVALFLLTSFITCLMSPKISHWRI